MSLARSLWVAAGLGGYQWVSSFLGKSLLISAGLGVYEGLVWHLWVSEGLVRSW